MSFNAHAYSFIRFNVDLATYVYGKVVGHMGRHVNPTGIPVQGKIQTTGSAVAVVASDTAGTDPFANVAVNDIIWVDRGTGTTDVRAVATRTDSDNITVDTAVDWSGGFSFTYLKQLTGATNSDGWIDVSGSDQVTIAIKWEQGDLATTLDWVIETRDGAMGGTPIQVDSGTIALALVGTTTGRVVKVQTAGYMSIRVGLKRTGADTSDVGANREIVDVSILIQKLTP